MGSACDNEHVERDRAEMDEEEEGERERENCVPAAYTRTQKLRTSFRRQPIRPVIDTPLRSAISN